MAALLELVEGFSELWCSWRFYLCLAVGAGGAVLLHRAFPDEAWIWFISIPLAIAFIVAGWRWQCAADQKED